MDDSSERTTHRTGHHTKNNSSMFWAIPLVIIILCGLSFYGGVAYQKGHAKSASTANAAGFGRFGGRFGNGQRPNIGDVTSVSSTSITIDNNFSGSSQTFSITSSTAVTNQGESASVSSIQTGDRVLVRTSSSSSTTATEIDINPSFGGGFGGDGSGSSGSTDNTNNPDNSPGQAVTD